MRPTISATATIQGTKLSHTFCTVAEPVKLETETLPAYREGPLDGRQDKVGATGRLLPGSDDEDCWETVPVAGPDLGDVAGVAGAVTEADTPSTLNEKLLAGGWPCGIVTVLEDRLSSEPEDEPGLDPGARLEGGGNVMPEEDVTPVYVIVD